MKPRFVKNVEDFKCENCSFDVVGDGYTNHCPKCLFSKHVDIFPGDRGEICHGLMEPIRVETEKGDYVIIQKCRTCNIERRIRSRKEDDFDMLIAVSKKLQKKLK
ncbi:MAG: RNHCP domain-containing protein [Patescibacteria group bacterium]